MTSFLEVTDKTTRKLRLIPLDGILLVTERLSDCVVTVSLGEIREPIDLAVEETYKEVLSRLLDMDEVEDVIGADEE